MEEHGSSASNQGQFIPVVHFVALADRPIYIAPQQRVRPSHRMVGPDQFKSGHTLEEGELALGPEIRLDVVQDRALLAAAARFDTSPHVPGVKDPSQIFSAPARFLIAPNGWSKKSFVLYQHIFGEGPSYPDDGFFYVGVTTRSWQKRWAEHRRAMQAGSLLLFHRKLREELSQGRLTYIHHKIMGITDDLERLYATEEWLVEGHWSDARRLNMIPGGKSGLRYLRENACLRSAWHRCLTIGTGWFKPGCVNIRAKDFPLLGFLKDGRTTLGRWRRSAGAMIAYRSSRCARSATLRRITRLRLSRNALVRVIRSRFNVSSTAKRIRA